MRCIRNYTRLTVSLIIIVLVVFILTTVNLAYESLQNGKLTEEISKENMTYKQDCEFKIKDAQKHFEKLDKVLKNWI